MSGRCRLSGRRNKKATGDSGLGTADSSVALGGQQLTVIAASLDRAPHQGREGREVEAGVFLSIEGAVGPEELPARLGVGEGDPPRRALGRLIRPEDVH